jgi:hypothetical protein
MVATAMFIFVQHVREYCIEFGFRHHFISGNLKMRIYDSLCERNLSEPGKKFAVVGKRLLGHSFGEHKFCSYFDGYHLTVLTDYSRFKNKKSI